MTLKQALAILVANKSAVEGSFLHALHERDTFDRARCRTLIDAMAVIAGAKPRLRGRDAGPAALHVYKYILRRIVFHFDPNDSSVVRRLPAKHLADYLECLDWVFAPVINGKPGYGALPDFDHGLKNAPKAGRKRLARRASRRRA